MRPPLKTFIFVPVSLLFVLAFLLAVIELSLRALGIFAAGPQHVRNMLAENHARGLHILVIGESTTADVFGQGAGAWPRQLEELLRGRGYAASVFNGAKPAATTASILKDLEYQLDRWQPDIVISMMGINDTGNLLVEPGEYRGWKSNLRIVKVARALIRAISYEPEPEPSSFGLEGTERLCQRLQTERYEDVAGALETELSKLRDDRRKAQYLAYLGLRSQPPWGSPAKAFMNTYALFRRSIELFFSVRGIDIRLARLANLLHRDDDCLELARLAKARGKLGSDSVAFVERLTVCAAAAEDKRPWAEILPADLGMFHIGKEGRADATLSHYRLLAETLHERRIPLIAMQYPNRPLSDLTRYFNDLPDSKIVFVSNEENFQDELRKRPYEQLFIDSFAKDFGHTTELGHQLIAKSALEGVIKVAEELNIHPAERKN